MLVSNIYDAVPGSIIEQYPASRTEAMTVMALYEKYPEIQAQFKDVKFLWSHFGDVGHLNTTKKQVKTLEDMKWLVMLTVGRGASESIKAFGGSPEPGDPTQVCPSTSRVPILSSISPR